MLTRDIAPSWHGCLEQLWNAGTVWDGFEWVLTVCGMCTALTVPGGLAAMSFDARAVWGRVHDMFIGNTTDNDTNNTNNTNDLIG